MLATIFHMSSGFSKIERVLFWQSRNFHFEKVNKISKVRLFEASGKHLKIICDFDSTKSRHAPEIGQTGHRQEMVMFPLKTVETHHFWKHWSHKCLCSKLSEIEEKLPINPMFILFPSFLIVALHGMALPTKAVSLFKVQESHGQGLLMLLPSTWSSDGCFYLHLSSADMAFSPLKTEKTAHVWSR